MNAIKKPVGSAPAQEYAEALGKLYGRKSTVVCDARPAQWPIDTLLSTLDRVRQGSRAGEFWASCPHPDHGKGRGDRTPSLHVTETPDRRVLIRCKAGCHSEGVLRAVGLTFKDLYPHDETTGAREHAYAVASEYVREPKRDWRDVERSIVGIAKADIEAGKDLSVEDRARVELALERLGGAS